MSGVGSGKKIGWNLVRVSTAKASGETLFRTHGNIEFVESAPDFVDLHVILPYLLPSIPADAIKLASLILRIIMETYSRMLKSLGKAL